MKNVRNILYVYVVFDELTQNQNTQTNSFAVFLTWVNQTVQRKNSIKFAI